MSTPSLRPPRTHTNQKVGDHTIHLDYDGTNALYLPTTTEATDAAVRSKYDDTIDADPTLPPVWSLDTLGARSWIRIAGDVTPTVESVSAPGTPSGTYGVGEIIDIEVLFTTRVFIKDSISLPYLLVEAGDEQGGEAQVRLQGVVETLTRVSLCTPGGRRRIISFREVNRHASIPGRKYCCIMSTYRGSFNESIGFE